MRNESLFFETEATYFLKLKFLMPACVLLCHICPYNHQRRFSCHDVVTHYFFFCYCMTAIGEMLSRFRISVAVHGSCF